MKKIKTMQPDRNLSYWLVVALFVGTGWLFRLRAFVANRSLWMDEAALANNILHFSLAELITKPLLHGQSAPIGFLVVVKLLVEWISESEKVLRLLPLGAGMVSVLLAVWLGSLVFENRLSRGVFVGLVALSPILIFYSTEFKQFMLDACLTMLILGLGVYHHRVMDTEADHVGGIKAKRSILGLGVVGIIGPWFSLPVVFYMFAAGVSLFWHAIRQKSKTAVIYLGVMGASWLVSFGLGISLLLNNVAEKQHLFEFWSAGFSPGLFSGISLWGWFIETGLAAVFLAFQEYLVSGPYFQAGWYTMPNILLGLVCFTGGVWLSIRNRPLGSLLLLSALAAWAVSFMGLYALRGRLFLFAVPIVLMFAAGLVEFLQERKIKTIDWLAAVSLIGVVLFSAIRFFGVPPAFSEIRSVLPHLASESIPGETRVAVSQWSMFAYEYYEPRFALQYLGQPYIIPHNFNMQEFLSTICADTDRGKVWLVFSHRMNEAHAFLNILREKTPELQNFESAGAGIYLFDFSEPGVCPDP